MRAVTLERARRMLLSERSLPRPERGEVVLRVEACGLNERDLDSWHYGLGKLPRVPGSEIVGIVEELGEQTSRESNIISLFSGRAANLSLGSRVVVAPYITASNSSEPYMIGFDGDGGLQEYFCCPSELCIEAPAHLSLYNLVCVPGLAEALGYVKELRVESGETVVVSGAECTGVLTAIAAQLYRANVLLVDPNQARLDLARQAGVEYTLNPFRSSVPEEMEWFAPGGTADVVVETSGDTAALPGLLAICGAGTRMGLSSSIDFDVSLSAIVDSGLRLIGLGTLIPDIRHALTVVGTTSVEKIVNLTLNLDELPAKISGIASTRKAIVKTVVTAPLM